MKGDVILVEEYHRRAASHIVSALKDRIKAKVDRYIITVAGESGSGKSELGQALHDELARAGVRSIVLGQDDYFVLPPKSNDERRRENPDWLGPHVEVRFDLLTQNLRDATRGLDEITKPAVNYDENSVSEETISLIGVDAIIVEGTYTSLLRDSDSRIFIDRNRADTLAHRQKRDRGAEAGDPFIEKILKTEHMIIAGHKNLADIVITKAYDVTLVE